MVRVLSARVKSRFGDDDIRHEKVPYNVGFTEMSEDLWPIFGRGLTLRSRQSHSFLAARNTSFAWASSVYAS